MNQDQLLGLLRNVISLGGGFALGRGYLTGEQVSLIGGIATSVVPVVWTYFSHTNSAKIAAVEAIPEVAKIVVNGGGLTDITGDPARPKVVRQ